MKLPLLAAPAGSFASIQAALKAGAGAVYFGAGTMNMRARSANNLSMRDVSKAVKICHAAGAEAWLALNIVIFDRELSLVKKIITQAKKAGIDAVIAADVSVMQAARDAKLTVHASTQLSVANISAVKHFSKWCDTIVPARELTLKEVAALVRGIKKDKICGPSGKPVKIEIFAHGALCLAQSGRCHLSLFFHNKSANRGECFQVCRSPYNLTHTENGDEIKIDHPFFLSPQDIATIGVLDEIVKSGVSVLKIEGRARDAFYVERVISVYKEALAAVGTASYNKKNIDAWRERLGGVFNRGLGEGYYLGADALALSGQHGNHSQIRKTFAGRVVKYFAKAGIAQFQIMNGPLKTGDAYVISGKTTGAVEGNIDSIYVDGKPAAEAGRSKDVTFKVPSRVHEGDELYLLRKRTNKDL